MFNPYVLGVAAIAFLLAVGGAGYKGYTFGRDSEIASQAKLEKVRQETRDIALVATAEVIAQLKPVHKTIQNRAEVITREVEIYRACRNDPSIVGLLNAARENRQPDQPASGRVVPDAVPGDAR